MAKSWDQITPEDVLKLEKPSESYLCPLSANAFGVEFLKFEIRDYDSGAPVYMSPTDIPDLPGVADEDLMRSVRYSFPADFLCFKTVRTMLEFQVGDKPLNNFRMIELHFFKDRLVRLYDFAFGFCIPGSCNTWEAIYDVPVLEPAQMKEYMDSPFEHKSDSYYFVDDKMIMHNKALFQYVA
eukprot:gene30898-35951_t